MTILYTDFKSFLSLQKRLDKGFTVRSFEDASKEKVINEIQNNINEGEEETSPSSFQEVSALLSHITAMSNDVNWQVRVLGDFYATSNKAIDTEILFLYTRLQQIQKKLSQQIQEKTKETIEELTSQKKLNLGAGALPLEGWVNIDVFPSDLPYNVNWGLPFEDNSVDFVYSAYLLEHIDYKNVPNLLNDVHRVLKKGGAMRLCVPNIKPYMMAYLENDHDFFEEIEQKWGFAFGGNLLEKLLNYAGCGNRIGVLDDHKFAYDTETLEDILKKAGFNTVYPSAYNQSPFPELNVDLNLLMQENYKNIPLALIYEAIK